MLSLSKWGYSSSFLHILLSGNRLMKIALMIDCVQWVEELIREKLSGLAELIVVNQEQGIRQGCEFEGLIAWRTTPELLHSCPQLKIIYVWGAGLDQIDLIEAKKRDIVVCHTGGAMAKAIAEYVICQILIWERRLLYWAEQARLGNWTWAQRNNHPFSELSGRSLGIIGLGRIGQAVANLASSFGMKIWAIKLHPEEIDEGIKGLLHFLGGPGDLSRLMSETDYITLHLPLNKQTLRLLGEEQLKQMKTNSVLINTARGAIIDESALNRALKEGWLRGASLDVLTEEPLPKTSPLRQRDNLILTCHQAGYTTQSVEAMVEIIKANTMAWQMHKSGLINQLT